MTGFLSPVHIMLLLVVLLLLFGAKRLPELGRSLGTGLREFKQSLDRPGGDDAPALAPAPADDGVEPSPARPTPTHRQAA